MRITISACFIALFLSTSCAKKYSNTQGSSALSETWNLVAMTSGSTVSEREEHHLEFQQTYIFNEDATFTKTQTNKNLALTGNGTYTTQNSQEGIYYTLLYTSQNEIVGSCTGRDTETLLLRPDGKLQNSWMMCDGPFLVYEKE